MKIKPTASSLILGAVIMVFVFFVLVITYIGYTLILEFSGRQWHYAVINMPNGNLSIEDVARIRAYRRLYISENYYDMGEFGYLVYQDDSPVPPGQERDFGFKDIEYSELQRLTKGYKKKIEGSESIENYLMGHYIYKSNYDDDEFRYVLLYDPAKNLSSIDKDSYSVEILNSDLIKFTDKIAGYSIHLPIKYKIEARMPTHLKLTDTSTNKIVGVIEYFVRTPEYFYRWFEISGEDEYVSAITPFKLSQDIPAYRYRYLDANGHSNSIAYMVNPVINLVAHKIAFFKYKDEGVYSDSEISQFDEIVKTYKKIPSSWQRTLVNEFEIYIPRNAQANLNIWPMKISSDQLNLEITIIEDTGIDRQNTLEREKLLAKIESNLDIERKIRNYDANSSIEIEYMELKSGAVKQVCWKDDVLHGSGKLIFIENTGISSPDFVNLCKMMDNYSEAPNYGLSEYNGMGQ